MARTIYFIDGSCEVILTDNWEKLKLEMKEILRNRLGEDIVDLFEEIIDGVPSAENADPAYELACDSYRELLQELFHELRSLNNTLDGGRIDRKKLTSTIERLTTAINNQL